MRRGVRLSAATALLVCAACGVPAPASARPAAWSAPRALGSRLSAQSSVTTAAAGDDTLAEWQDDAGVFVAMAGADGRFGTPEVLSRRGVGDGQTVHLAAINASGDAAVAFSRATLNDSLTPVYLSYRRPGGRFSAPRRVTPPQEGAAMAIDSAGEVTIAWQQQTATGTFIRVRRLGADGAVGPVQTVAAGTQSGYNAVGAVTSGSQTLGDLEENAAGQAILTYTAETDVTGVSGVSRLAHAEVVAAVRPAAAKRFSAPVRIASTHSGVYREAPAAIDAAGDAVIVWDGPFTEGGRALAGTVQAAHLSVTTGAVSGHQVLGHPGIKSVTDTLGIGVDENAAGDAVAGWQIITSLTGGELEISRAAAGARFGSASAVVKTDGEAEWSAAVSPSGAVGVSAIGIVDPTEVRLAPSFLAPFGAAKVFGGNDSSDATPLVVTAAGRFTEIWRPGVLSKRFAYSSAND